MTALFLASLNRPVMSLILSYFSAPLNRVEIPFLSLLRCLSYFSAILNTFEMITLSLTVPNRQEMPSLFLSAPQSKHTVVHLNRPKMSILSLNSSCQTWYDYSVSQWFPTDKRCLSCFWPPLSQSTQLSIWTDPRCLFYFSAILNRPKMSILSLSYSQQTQDVYSISQQFSTDPRCLFYFSAILNRPKMSILSLSHSQQTQDVYSISQPFSTDPRCLFYLSAILNRPPMIILFLSDPQQTRDACSVFVLLLSDIHSTCLAVFAGSENVIVKKQIKHQAHYYKV